MKAKKRPKIGLAIGGGAARALSYLGILEVLEENNIKPDYIAGTSMGSFIGALYSAGYSVKDIRTIFKRVNWQAIADLSLPKTGLINLEDLKNKISSDTAAVYFENPTFLGSIESQGDEISKIAHENGAESIVGVDPISLGVLAPPSDYGADIVVAMHNH